MRVKVIFDKTGKLADPETVGLSLFDGNRLKSNKEESYFEFLKKLLFITFFALVFFFVANESFPSILNFLGILLVFGIVILIAFFVPYFMNVVLRRLTVNRVVFFFVLFSGLIIFLGAFL